MIETTRRSTATASDVWKVLCDGWLYASWVVGASRIRDVDADWPAEATKIHHSVGGWPVLLDDETLVLESEPGLRLKLRAKTRPAGEAEVELILADAEDGGCLIRMREDIVSGPARLVPKAVRQLAIVPRNKESLQRLAYLAEGRAR